MGFVKAIFIVAITMALSIALIITNKKVINSQQDPAHEVSKLPDSMNHDENKILIPSKRVSRFLATEAKNPRAADHCHKDHEVCYLEGAKNTTCCNNKCMDLGYDNHNCGACKNKCKYTEQCCRGECVYLAFDKRHCGACNDRCPKGEYCVYGMCGYA